MRWSLGLFAVAISACSGDTRFGVGDAAPQDSGPRDIPAFDAGLIDSGPRPDSGPPGDAGFADPDTLLEGLHRIDGLDTWVVVLGTLTSTHPAAIVLHDGPGLSHEYLLPHLKSIMPGRTLVLYDMRAMGRSGFGDGTGTSTITADEHARDLGDVIDFLGGFRDVATVDLVGHGYGAGIAMLYAAANPERVDHLVLTAPYPASQHQFLDTDALTMRRLSTDERMRISNITNRSECLRDFSLCYLQVWAIIGPHLMCLENLDRWSEMNFMFGNYRAKIFVELELRDKNYDWRQLMAAVTATTTVISGDCDVNGTEIGRTYTSSIAGAVHHRILTSGHFPFVEAPEEYNRLLREALAR